MRQNIHSLKQREGKPFSLLFQSSQSKEQPNAYVPSNESVVIDSQQVKLNELKEDNTCQPQKDYEDPSPSPKKRPQQKIISTQQQQIDKLISRICEERLFPSFVRQCVKGGVIDPVKARQYGAPKEGYVNRNVQVKKLDLSNGYNSISNYTRANHSLYADIIQGKDILERSKTLEGKRISTRSLSPEANIITSKQKKIKNFFEGNQPSRIKMDILPPIGHIRRVIQNDTRVSDSQNDRQINKQTQEILLLDKITEGKTFVSFVEQSSDKRQRRSESSTESHQISQNNLEPKIFHTPLKKSSNFLKESQRYFSERKQGKMSFYEMDVEKYQRRETPTPFKEPFMPQYYRDRIYVLTTHQ